MENVKAPPELGNFLSRVDLPILECIRNSTPLELLEAYGYPATAAVQALCSETGIEERDCYYSVKYLKAIGLVK